MLPILLALNTGLIVETSTPDALCPPLELVKTAVSDRLGTIQLSGPWTLHYESVHRESGDYVHLELRGPAGAVRLEREFAGYGESCATLAQVMAVVVERYFRSFQSDDNPSGSELDDAPRAAAKKVQAEQVALQALELGAAFDTDLPFEPFIRYSWQRRGPAELLGFFSLQLGIAPLPQKQSIFAGEAELWSGDLGVSFGAGGEWGRGLRWRLGPLFSGRVEHVVTRGLPESSHGTRFVPAAGLSATVAVSLGAGFSAVFGASALGLGRFAAPEFRVDSRQIFAIPELGAGANVALGKAF